MRIAFLALSVLNSMCTT